MSRIHPRAGQPPRLRLGRALLLLSALALTLLVLFAPGEALIAQDPPAPDGTAEPPPPGHTVDIRIGWNLVGWLGPDTPVPDALGDTLAAVASVNTFNAVTQSFQTFTPAGPDFLNSLDILPAGAGVWLLATQATTWDQPGLPDPNGELATAQLGPPPPRDVPLLPGFNLVAWTGDHQAPIADALSALQELDSLFLWDAPTELFLSYGPARLPRLNSAQTLPFGAGLWILMAAAATWTQPPAALFPDGSGRLEFPNIAARLIIPPGALPPGVAPFDLQIADASGDPEFADPESGAGPDFLLRLEPTGLAFEPALTIELVLPLGSNAAVALISDDGQVELIEGTTSNTPEGADQTTLTIPIQHFSTVAGFFLTPFSLDAPDPGVHLVGASFEVSAVISRALRSSSTPLHSSLFGTIDFFLDVPSEPERAAWDPFSVFNSSGPVTPARKVGTETIYELDQARFTSEFTCVAPGLFSVLVRATARSMFDETTSLSSNPRPVELFAVETTTVFGTCVEPVLVTDLEQQGCAKWSQTAPGSGNDFISRARFAGTVVRELPLDPSDEDPLVFLVGVPDCVATATIVFPDESEKQETVTTDANGGWSIGAVHSKTGTFTIKDIRITCPPDHSFVHESDATTSITVT